MNPIERLDPYQENILNQQLPNGHNRFRTHWEECFYLLGQLIRRVVELVCNFFKRGWSRLREAAGFEGVIEARSGYPLVRSPVRRLACEPLTPAEYLPPALPLDVRAEIVD